MEKPCRTLVALYHSRIVCQVVTYKWFVWRGIAGPDGEINSPLQRSGAGRLGRRPLQGGEESAGESPPRKTAKPKPARLKSKRAAPHPPPCKGLPPAWRLGWRDKLAATGLNAARLRRRPLQGRGGICGELAPRKTAKSKPARLKSKRAAPHPPPYKGLPPADSSS
jgi:hypothetical protein